MENEKMSKIRETLETIFKGVNGLVDTKKVIGEPYVVGDTTIIPFIETSMGLGATDLQSDKEAAGAGCKVRPIACLVIQDGFTKLINIDNQDAISKALDLIPDLVEKLFKKSDDNEKIDNAIKEISADYDGE
ncbi:MAG: sporulation protein [Lachnospiraceae bacterium]|nr:sporulation protein [Lachnospiraceae bacterium]